MKERMATSCIEVFDTYATIWPENSLGVSLDPIHVYLEGVEITYTQAFSVTRSPQKVTCFSKHPLEVQVVAHTLFI